MAKNTDTETPSSKNGTVIAPHGCKSEYQDKRYGRGQRVWNQGKSKRTCTVCGEAK